LVRPLQPRESCIAWGPLALIWRWRLRLGLLNDRQDLTGEQFQPLAHLLDRHAAKLRPNDQDSRARGLLLRQYFFSERVRVPNQELTGVFSVCRGVGATEGSLALQVIVGAVLVPFLLQLP